MKYVLFATLFAAAVETCCDPHHADYVRISEKTIVSQTKGGIAITKQEMDQGGHIFDILTSCAFPCDQRLNVEKP